MVNCIIDLNSKLKFPAIVYSSAIFQSLIRFSDGQWEGIKCQRRNSVLLSWESNWTKGEKVLNVALLKGFSLACAYKNSRIIHFHALYKTEDFKGTLCFQGCFRLSAQTFQGYAHTVSAALRSTSEEKLEKRWFSWKNNKLSAGRTENKF